MRVWEAAQKVVINTSDDIVGNFDIGFDDSIDETTRNKYRKFVAWVEKNYKIPVTLWVDFEDKNYLVGRDKKQKGYLFYWCDWPDYPDFRDIKDIPEIRLPIKEKYWSFESIIYSFVQAISYYYTWLLNLDIDKNTIDEDEVQEIVDLYFDTLEEKSLY